MQMPGGTNSAMFSSWASSRPIPRRDRGRQQIPYGLTPNIPAGGLLPKHQTSTGGWIRRGDGQAVLSGQGKARQAAGMAQSAHSAHLLRCPDCYRRVRDQGNRCCFAAPRCASANCGQHITAQLCPLYPRTPGNMCRRRGHVLARWNEDSHCGYQHAGDWPASMRGRSDPGSQGDGAAGGTAQRRLA